MRRWNLILRVFMAEYLGLLPDVSHSRRDETPEFSRSDSELVSYFSFTLLVVRLNLWLVDRFHYVPESR